MSTAPYVVPPDRETLTHLIEAWFTNRRGARAVASDREHAEDLAAYLHELIETWVLMRVDDLDREAPADRFVCPACHGYASLLPDPSDPASVIECDTCDGTGRVAA